VKFSVEACGRQEEYPVVQVMTLEEYKKLDTSVSKELIFERNLHHIHYCKADWLDNAILGTFLITQKEELLGEKRGFSFYLDKRRLLFIDDTGIAEKLMGEILEEKGSEKTSLVHLLFQFMEYLIRDDVLFLQKYEEKLTSMEEELLDKGLENINRAILRCRKELLRLNSYYEQLADMSETLVENHNAFLNDKDCYLFRLFGDRASRLYSNTQALKEYTMQIREMYQSQIDIRQNRIMGFLTIVTTIFMPLTLVAGWYGMNFEGMPELHWRYGYPLVAFISLLIILLEIWYFIKKRWLK
jgi:magnesium transporter